MDSTIVGEGPLFSDPDPEKARAFFRHKSRALEDKVMSVKEAVTRFVHDGEYLGSGGFGTNRIATAALHEVLRQKKRNLSFAGHTATHDFQILAAGNIGGEKLLAKVDLAYVVGLEARGLSPHSRRVIESGQLETCEWTNYALACRLHAAAMGVPYMLSRNMLGTETFTYSAAKQLVCPFTGRKVVALPALYPDVALIHVHESDGYGNCRIYGVTVADLDLARAAKRLIITCERLISNEEIRRAPHLTVIPSLCVDAVCEVPGGCYPGNMPGEYFSDEEHLRQWLEVEKDEAQFVRFIDEYIYGVPDFAGYLEKCGGPARLAQLRDLELLKG